MTPSHALIEAVRDQLRLTFGKDSKHIDNQADGMPPANSGQWYIAIYPAGMTAGPGNEANLGLDSMYSVGIGITQRTGIVPDDRMLRDAIYRQNGAGVIAERVRKAMRLNRYAITQDARTKLTAIPVREQNPKPEVASTIVQQESAATHIEYEGKYVEPLTLSSGTLSFQKVGPRHFKAPPCLKQRCDHRSCASAKDYGLFVEMVFGGCRYMEEAVSFTTGFSSEFG